MDDSASLDRTAAAGELQSVDTKDLQTAIDRLRSENVDAVISIPQIVVCGDQSSGKSSVLEAIARVPFPSGTGITTRFATELVLQHAQMLDIKVSIMPGDDRSEDEQAQILQWSPDFEVDDAMQLKSVIDAADSFLRSMDTSRQVWTDRLKLHISGPTQPHLTLVDLPGIVNTNDASNSMKQILGLTRQYLQNPRAIILAVLSANYDLELQMITDLVKEAPNGRERCLGIITKPDLLSAGSDAESEKIKLARNEKVKMGFGWHVLKNLPHEDHDRSAAHRDEAEQLFFASHTWSTLDRRCLGVGALQEKMRDLLRDRIRQDLPDLTMEMEKRLKECKNHLKRLGRGRETEMEQRRYLVEISAELRRLVEAALSAEYTRNEFANFFDETQTKRLRDTINVHNREFAAEIVQKGRQFHLYHNNENSPDRWNNIPNVDADDGGIKFYPPYNSHGPVNVDFENYGRQLKDHMSRNCGMNPPGLPSWQVIQTVFRQQSRPWLEIAQKHTEKCFRVVFEFFVLAVQHVAGRYTGGALLREYVNNAFDRKSASLEAKLTELFWPYTKSHPMSYNLHYKFTLENYDGETAIWGKLAHTIFASGGPDFIEAAKVIDFEQAYYQAAVQNLVDNVATLAVEACLLDDLPTILSPETIAVEDAEVVRRVASEPLEERAERRKAQSQADTLTDVIRVCKRHTSQLGNTDSTFSSLQPPATTSSSSTLERTRTPESTIETPAAFTEASTPTPQRIVDRTPATILTPPPSGGKSPEPRVTSPAQNGESHNTDAARKDSTPKAALETPQPSPRPMTRLSSRTRQRPSTSTTPSDSSLASGGGGSLFGGARADTASSSINQATPSSGGLSSGGGTGLFGGPGPGPDSASPAINQQTSSSTPFFVSGGGGGGWNFGLTQKASNASDRQPSLFGTQSKTLASEKSASLFGGGVSA